MKTSKRFLSIVLMLAMLVSMFTVMAFAGAEPGGNQYSSVTVTVESSENGTVAVKDKNNNSVGSNITGTQTIQFTDSDNFYLVATAASGYKVEVVMNGYTGYEARIPLYSQMNGFTFTYRFVEDGNSSTEEPVESTEYKVRVTINGKEYGTITDSNNREIRDGSTITVTDENVTLTATPNRNTECNVVWNLNNSKISYNNTFSLEASDLEDAGNNLTITLVELKPIPDADDYKLTVKAGDHGSICLNKGSLRDSDWTYLAEDDTFTAEAYADAGYEFVRWEAKGINLGRKATNPELRNLVMPDNDVTLTAVFTRKSSSSCSHSYVENYNDTYHWKECKYCGAVKSNSKEKHDLYSYKKNGYTYKYCKDCGYDSYTYDYDKHPSSHDSYVYTDLNASYHLKECSKKGCSYEVKEYHTWIKNDKKSTKADYPYVCKYCDRLSKTAYTDLPFRDVDGNVWYYDDVLYAYINGYMDGLSAGQFAPNQNTTRAQIVTILWRLTGEPRATKSNKFSDVSSSAYYDKAVSWAVEAGVVNGFDAKTFKPNDYVTREQLAAILYRYAEYMNVSTRGASNLTKYDDYYQIGTWARDAMAWANYHGLINGVSYTRIDPKGNATRAQVAAILHRFAVEFGNY